MINEKTVSLQWISPNEIQWDRYRTIFIQAFTNQFKEFSLAELSPKATDRTELFESWFNLEQSFETTMILEDAKGEGKKFYFLEAQSEKAAVGYAIWHFDPENPFSLYLSSLAILPQWQRRGLGTRMVYYIREKLPHLKNFVLNTRVSEQNHVHGFLKTILNCSPCAIFPDESLEDPQKFTGYRCPL